MMEIEDGRMARGMERKLPDKKQDDFGEFCMPCSILCSCSREREGERERKRDRERERARETRAQSAKSQEDPMLQP